MINKKVTIDFSSGETRKKLLIVFLAVLALVGALVFYAVSSKTDEDFTSEDIQQTESEVETAQDETGGHIYVDISGAVKDPAVIVLEQGSRIFEAIEAAGGLEKGADLREINRAEVLEDGAYLYIPTTKELESQVASEVPSVGSSSPAGSEGSSQSIININTADSNTLQQLNGVGPATAEKIIQYRTSNGKFNNIEDIKNISGIGDKTFEKLAPYIKV